MKEVLIGIIDGNIEVERAIESLGGVTVTIDDVDVFDELRPGILDGIVLCGGTDVDPKRYGATEKHPQVWAIDRVRDELELEAVAYADKTDTPLFGICRGSQVINISRGGTLHQHIDDMTYIGHFMGNHWIELLRTSHLSKATKASGMTVNSLHHQAVERIGEGLIPVAWGDDGVIEAIESLPWAKQFIMGVQFHPEMLQSRPDMKRIFREFVRAARRHSKGRAAPILRESELEDVITRVDIANGNYTAKGEWTMSYGWDNDLDWPGRDDIRRTREEDDAYCAFPPCHYPGGCNPREGDCLAEAVALGNTKPRRKKEFDHDWVEVEPGIWRPLYDG